MQMMAEKNQDSLAHSLRNNSWLVNFLTGLFLLALALLLTIALSDAVNLLLLRYLSSSGADPQRILQAQSLFGNDLLIFALVTSLLLGLWLWQRPHLLLTAVIVVLLFFTLNLVSGRHILPLFLIRPFPQQLAKGYVNALATNHVDTALKLTDDSDLCQKNVMALFQEHQALFRQKMGNATPAAPVRTIDVVQIATGYQTSSPIPGQMLTLKVELESEATVWLTLRSTYKPWFGRRYLCG